MDGWRWILSRIGARGAALAMLGAISVAALASSTARAQSLKGPTWRAERIMGGAADRAASTISIAPGSKVGGSGGCNRLMGTATIAGESITFGALGSTRMACAPAVMAQERRFLEALEAARAFRIEGGRLRLLDAAGAELARFTQAR